MTETAVTLRNTKRKGPCSATFIIRLLDSIALVAVVACQGTALNLFMKEYESIFYFDAYLWFIGDGIVLLVFVLALIMSYRFFLDPLHQKLEPYDIPHIEVPMYGVLPFGYISWFIYAGVLIAKVVVIFRSELGSMLTNETMYSTITLKITLALTVVIFILLVNSHHDAEPNTERNNYIADLCKGTAFDIFDSIDFLSFLLFQDSHLNSLPDVYTVQLRDTIISLACINFLLPALSLVRLSLSDFGEFQQPLKLSLLVKSLKLFFINFPYMVIRIYLWKADDAISLFLVKNILYVVISLRYMIPEYINAFRWRCRPPPPKVVRPSYPNETTVMPAGLTMA